MRNNETGEFELVVGNRQLLSGFFIIVLLFAVAFAMGYVVGQNSPRSSKIETAATPTPTPLPVPDTSRQASVAAADPTPPATTPPDSGASAPAEPPPASAPPQAAPPVPAPASDSGGPPAPAPGTYWQVAALPEPDAKVIASSLKEKGLPIVLSPVPNTPNLTRVLVGPYTDQQSLGRAKTELENAGFHPLLRKP